jgi:hypothetical protein
MARTIFAAAVEVLTSPQAALVVRQAAERAARENMG